MSGSLAGVQGWLGGAHLEALAVRLWCGDGSPAIVTVGRLPEGFVELASYAVLPSPRFPQLLVPPYARTARAALTAYSGLRRPRARHGRAALAVALRLGGGPVLLRRRLTVGLPQGRPRGEGDQVVSELRVMAALGRQDVRLAVGVREPTTHFKPTLQVFLPPDQLVGFAKLGWNRATDDRVRTEVAALRQVAARPAASFRAPSVLDSRHDESGEMSLVEPLPLDVRRHDPFFTPPRAQVMLDVAEMGQVSSTTLAESRYVAALADRLRRLPPTGAVPECLALLGRLAAESATVSLRLGGWHGDLVPWNVADHDDGLVIWDWEYYAPAAPVGFDLIHWFVQGRFARGDLDLVHALGAAEQSAAPGLAELGLSTAARIAVVSLYLLEICARETELQLADPSMTSRWLSQVGPALASRL